MDLDLRRAQPFTFLGAVPAATPEDMVKAFQAQLNRFATLASFKPVVLNGVVDPSTEAAARAVAAYIALRQDVVTTQEIFNVSICQDYACITSLVTAGPQLTTDLRLAGDALKLPPASTKKSRKWLGGALVGGGVVLVGALAAVFVGRASKR